MSGGRTGAEVVRAAELHIYPVDPNLCVQDDKSGSRAVRVVCPDPTSLTHSLSSSVRPFVSFAPSRCWQQPLILPVARMMNEQDRTASDYT